MKKVIKAGACGRIAAGLISMSLAFYAAGMTGCSSSSDSTSEEAESAESGNVEPGAEQNADEESEDIPQSAEGLSAFVSLNVSDMGDKTYKAREKTNNVVVNASEEESVVVEKGKATVGSKKYTKRLKLGGIGSETNRSVTIYVGAGKSGTLTVDCASSSSSDATRELKANGGSLGKAPTKAGTLSAAVTADESGYISLYSANGGGINIYGIYWSDSSAPSSAGGGDDKKCSSEASTPALDNSSTAPSYKNGLKVGTRTDISSVATDSLQSFLYVAPDGTPTGEGTKASPMDIATAIAKLRPGEAIVLKGGTYAFSETVKIAYGNNGESGARKYILPESGSAAVFDFSSQPTADSSRGVQLDGDYWHIYGITCYNAGDNGMYVTGKSNIIERCVFQANQDTGLQIARRASSLSDMADWPADNLVLNCTSFDNKDDKTGENADGFAAKLTCGEGNVFDGCISYANCDDGWDLYAKPATGPIGVVTIRNCVAFQNGKTTSGANYANGDMNGFKLGGSNNQCPTAHVVENSVAFLNGKDGFTDNGNGGALSVSNCSSYGNVNSNFNFYRTLAGGSFKNLVSMTGSVVPAQVDKFGGKEGEVSVPARIADSVYLVDKKKAGFYFVGEESEIFNGSKTGTPVADPYKSELKSTKAPAVDLFVDASCRNSDGTVNLGGFLEIKEGSTLQTLGAAFGDEAETVIPCGL